MFLPITIQLLKIGQLFNNFYQFFTDQNYGNIF